MAAEQARKKKVRINRGRPVDLKALEEIRALLGDEPRRRDLLIEHLHKIQDAYGHISARHLRALAHEMNLSQAEVYEVATFYHHFDVVKEGETPPPPLTIRVCESLACQMNGAHELIDALKQGLGDQVRVLPAPCVGRCQHAPVAIVGQNPIDRATPEKVGAVVEAKAVEAPVPDYIDYDAYRSQGGYELLLGLVEGHRDPETVIASLKDAGLRGLGGAGFPAGVKWDIVRKQPAPRYLAVNIDEGEPGTFKDRHYLESDPHRFLEGALVAARVVGCEAIYIYLRDEYPAARKILQTELARLQADPPVRGWLPPIHLRRGAGAYICGEESAMIESIEGKRGMPRLRPPYLAEVGLFGRPTLEHNMETLHWVRDIVEKGPDWFTSFGRHGRKGLRSFSVSGRVKKPGVHLAPAGITVKELIDEYCGGMLDGHEFYGYFPGGASGGILPASLGDIPLDFDTLNPYGCFIGSAAVVVFSQHDKAKDLALNAIKFFEDESCGQCTPCRVGTAKAALLMENGDWGRARLDDLCQVMADASICGLGQAAPNPIRCVFKYFPHELEG
ncbi:formate dehydrogenase beta subunit [Methylomarinovum caldicuralii]|uniref:NADH-quinone oxidoreductase subunit F n=1 Tax=Methylomarinovum caldicuralii TaxID=438856 RepID=A0AAU9C244_9GAMM|nr:NAD(P)H-dependent oxidoreductase subunit E [Methylomarinovum caldicuralii]BCX82442.1 formate dehydrogenase beta subunit [Methylomarinovum caldicuralii]